MYNNTQAILLFLHAPKTPRVGSTGKNIFSESSHVSYQIKKNGTFNNMIVNMLYLHTTSTPGLKVKLFSSDSSHAAYQLNRKAGHAQTMVIYTIGGLGGVGRFP